MVAKQKTTKKKPTKKAMTTKKATKKVAKKKVTEKVTKTKEVAVAKSSPPTPAKPKAKRRRGMSVAEAARNSETDASGFVMINGRRVRVCTRCIDQCDNRYFEFFREFHFVKCFSVSLRMSATKVARDSFLGVLALLVTNKQHFVGSNSCKSSTDCWIISKMSVTVQFSEISANHADVVGCLGAILMPCNFDSLPRCNIFIQFF